MACTRGGGGAQVWNSTTIMALSARLPWLTALVLPQRQLETPQRQRLSHSEPPRRERAINSVYLWTEFVVVARGVCAVMGVLNLSIHMFDFTISLLLSVCVCAGVFLRGALLKCGYFWNGFGLAYVCMDLSASLWMFFREMIKMY